MKTRYGCTNHLATIAVLANDYLTAMSDVQLANSIVSVHCSKQCHLKKDLNP
jgi:hypothetical protein